MSLIQATDMVLRRWNTEPRNRDLPGLPIVPFATGCTSLEQVGGRGYGMRRLFIIFFSLSHPSCFSHGSVSLLD
ncbi:hypothetical protein ANTPLA_LOCUS7187 [Anthophora plagiata]